ncbi:MAG: RluA family pseudouridine synthase [Isosphaeraceae bacterium]
MTEPEARATPGGLVIVHEDPYLVAVVKPAGLLTQANASHEPTLEEAVRRYLSPEAPSSIYLGTVHRLDRPVSGLVVWARTAKAARRLSGQFERRTTEKTYWAIVEPHAAAGPPGAEDLWDDWLAGSSDASGVVAVLGPDQPGARRAVTRLRWFPVPPPFTVPEGLRAVELNPQTGRTHQLRSQAAHRGWPIWGDRAYGSTRPFAAGAIALHARALRFVHPGSLETMTLVAPLPEIWASSHESA